MTALSAKGRERIGNMAHKSAQKKLKDSMPPPEIMMYGRKMSSDVIRDMRGGKVVLTPDALEVVLAMLTCIIQESNEQLTAPAPENPHPSRAGRLDALRVEMGVIKKLGGRFRNCFQKSQVYMNAAFIDEVFGKAILGPHAPKEGGLS